MLCQTRNSFRVPSLLLGVEHSLEFNSLSCMVTLTLKWVQVSCEFLDYVDFFLIAKLNTI